MKGPDGALNVQEPMYSSSDEAGLAETEIGQTRRVWYRSVPFQIAVASGVSFTAPGMWDALGGLGAGGAAEPVSDTFHQNPVLEYMKHRSKTQELTSDAAL